MNPASGGLGRTLRLLATALVGAASVTACGSAAPVARHSPAPSGTARSSGTPGAFAAWTPGPLPGGGVIPAHISVPAIGVSAPVVTVGETSTGDLQSPDGWDDVGWFSPGFRPGAPGHAVLNGHLDTNLADRPTAVFWNLRKLRAGDAVHLTAADGTTLDFTVSVLTYYPAEKAPLNQIFGPSNDSVLQLVTCAGIWRGAKLGYSDRLVVSATLNKA